jgi:NADH dehydrogenase/NADH:ubiquinone oxidoreductase subunit G
MLLLTGALTSKPYAFTSRPWELRSVNSIDILDGVGSNIRVDFKETEVVRILPRKNPDLNENWISDKIRFFYDGLKRQRLTSPYVKKEGELKAVKWKKAISKFSSVLKVYSFEYGPSSVGLIGSSALDLETLYSMKNFSVNLGFSFLGIDRPLKSDLDNPKNYKFQSRITDFEGSDFCLFLGTNPRFEASTLNLRLRKIFRKGNSSFASVGATYAPTFPTQFLSLSSKALISIAQGKHPICKSLAKAKRPIIVYGSKLLERADSLSLQNLLNKAASTFADVLGRTLSLNLLHASSNAVGAFELGIKGLNEADLSKLKVLYTIGLENSTMLEKSLKKAGSPILILQSSHGDKNTNNADIVLPSYTFVEKTGIYYNIEGRPQTTQAALVGPNLSREDWKIFRVLFSALERQATYNTKSQLITETSKILPSSFFANRWFTKISQSRFDFEFSQEGRIYQSPFKLFIEDFYMTSTLCQSSRIMAKASEFLRSYSNNYKFLNWVSTKN